MATNLFGVKLWRTWTEQGFASPAAYEEAVLLVRATSRDEAAQLALARSAAADGVFENERGAPVTITTLGVDFVFDTYETRAISGLEVFARVYENGEAPDFGPTRELIESLPEP